MDAKFMQNELTKEKINYYVEMLKIFWAIFIILTGSILTMILSINLKINFEEGLKMSFIILGISFDYVVIMLIKDFNKNIFCLLNNLEKR